MYKQVPKEIPHDWFQQGIANNPFQKYWHKKRFKLIIEELKKINYSTFSQLRCRLLMFTSI